MKIIILSIFTLLLISNVQAFDKKNLAQVFQGVLEQLNSDVSIYDCINESTNEGEILLQAIHLFEKKTAADTFDALKLIAQALQTLPESMKQCKALPTQIEKIEQCLKEFNSPSKFAFHIGKDILINGVQIFQDIVDAIGAYNNKNWEQFGKSIGDAMVKILIGQDSTVSLIAIQDSSFDIHSLEQVFKGMLEAWSSEVNIIGCINGISNEATTFKTAIEDFESKDAAKVEEGVKLISEAIKELPAALNTCKALPEEIKKVEEMIKTIASPKSFIFHIGKDIIVNRVQIYDDIQGCLKDYKGQNWEEFGKYLGDALEKILIGNQSLLTLEAVNFDIHALEQVFTGLLEAWSSEVNIYGCVSGIANEARTFKTAIENFESKDAAKVEEGVKLIGEGIKSLPEALNTCKALPDQIHLVEEMIKNIANPKSFAFHIGKDILVNGVQIYSDITACVEDYKSQNWEDFGKKLGNALMLTLVGKYELFEQ